MMVTLELAKQRYRETSLRRTESTQRDSGGSSLPGRGLGRTSGSRRNRSDSAITGMDTAYGTVPADPRLLRSRNSVLGLPIHRERRST